MTFSKSRLFATLLRTAAATDSFSISVTPVSPTRERQRLIIDWSVGGSCSKNVPPQNDCQYGFSTHPSRTSWSLSPYMVRSIMRPTIVRTGIDGRPLFWQ